MTSMEKYLPLILLAGLAATLFIAMEINDALAKKRRRRKRGAMGNNPDLVNYNQKVYFGSEEMLSLSHVLDTLWSGEYMLHFCPTRYNNKPIPTFCLDYVY